MEKLKMDTAKILDEEGDLILPATIKPASKSSDALYDFFLRVRQIINFVGEVVVSSELGKNQLSDDIKLKPNWDSLYSTTKDIEFPQVSIKSDEWNLLVKRLPERLFFSSILQLATAFETYLSELFHEILNRHPELLMIDEKQLSTKEIFQHSSLDDLRNTLIERKIIGLLMNPYPKQVRNISSLFKVEFHGSKSPMPLFEVHDFFEVRNVVAHNDGYTRETYFERMKEYEQSTYIKRSKSELGFVRIDFNWFFKISESFLNQCLFIDNQLTKKWNTSK